MGSKIKLDRIVVVDLEATCWKYSPLEGQVSEIIEIGACSLNMENFEIENRSSYVVKPRFSKVSEYCTELTTLTPRQVNQGIPFGDAVNIFKKEFGIKNRSWASWGNGDKNLFLKNCELYNVEYPF